MIGNGFCPGDNFAEQVEKLKQVLTPDVHGEIPFEVENITRVKTACEEASTEKEWEIVYDMLAMMRSGVIAVHADQKYRDRCACYVEIMEPYWNRHCGEVCPF